MIHPIPSGTRDVLPDEMRELRQLEDALRRRFEGASYGEVHTPAMEYEDVLRRGDERAVGAGYRLFDEQGHVVALRSDMTIPIARLVATRYAEAGVPLRLCYFAHAYRAVARGSGQDREFMQAGLELIGSDAPEGEAEVLGLAIEGLVDAGLRRHRVGVGDASLYGTLLNDLGVADDDRAELLDALSRRDLPALEARVERMGLESSAHELLARLPFMRGGAEVLDAPEGPVRRAGENLRGIHELLAERGLAERVIFDLGLVRELGYYTGAVFEIYDPAVGFALGGGGRYDDLLGRFGRPLAACGLALDVQRVHMAQAAEEGSR